MRITSVRRRLENWRRAHCSGGAVTRVCLGAILFVVIGQGVRAAGNDLPLELRPYQVVLLVAIDVPQQSKAARDELLERIRQTAARCLGAQWMLTVEDAEWLQPVSADGLSRLTIAEVGKHSARGLHDFDVWLVATVRSHGSGFRVDVRGWQPAIEIDSGIVGGETYDWRELPLTLLQLSHASFRPIGIIDDVDGKQARVLLQANALSVPDPAFALSREAQVFVPVLAGRNRDRKIERLQRIPWTFLTAGPPDGTRLTCELQSGLRSAIGGKQRGRVEALALTVTASLPATRLELMTQSKPALPLTGHRIELRRSSEIPRADQAKEKDDHLIETLLTDRRGRVIVPASTGKVVWLFAYSGKHLLARVPMLPGMQADLRLEVPDDSARLEAESDLYMLQGQLVEAVAARNTAAAKIRAAIKKDDLPLAKAAESELRKQPDAQVFLNQLASIRVAATKAAKSRRDRAGEARINRMCDEMAELIQQYLSEDKRQVALEELKELLGP